jgi:hypothetical protein
LGTISGLYFRIALLVLIASKVSSAQIPRPLRRLHAAFRALQNTLRAVLIDEEFFTPLISCEPNSTARTGLSCDGGFRELSGRLLVLGAKTMIVVTADSRGPIGLQSSILMNQAKAIRADWHACRPGLIVAK